MKEYFLGLLAVCTVCSLGVILLGRRLSGALRVGLCALVLTAALSPALSALSELPTDLILPGGETVGDGEFLAAMEGAFLDGARDYLCSELSLPSEGVSLSCKGFSYRDMRAQSITALLSGRAATAEPRRVRELLGGLVFDGGEVFVEYKILD